MLNMYCLRSTPTAPPLVVLTDSQPLSSRAALSAHKTNDLFINTLPENMARILGGEMYRRQIQQTCNTYISDTSLLPLVLLIVPTLRVGMHPVTLCLTASEADAERPWRQP